MKIEVRKITDLALMKEVLEFVYKIPKSTMTLDKAYQQEHSIIRSQMFFIKMEDIPTKASVHFVRHAAVGQLHVVSTNREDLNKDAQDEQINRLTPVRHVMLLNAGHLIDMAKLRMCFKSEQTTRALMMEIKNQVSLVDPSLAALMVPKCYYRNGICTEPKSCGLYVSVLKQLINNVPEYVYRDARNEKLIAEGSRIIH